MIRRFSYGTVFETDAVLDKPEAQSAALPYFAVDEEQRSLTYPMERDAVVYGLGENVRGINKRGWIYESRCSDEPHHHEDKKSLYAAHNFILYDGKERSFGLFIDYPGILTFDIGFTDSSVLKITAADWNLDAYLIEGENDRDIVRQFRRLIGRSYIPPVWAFGVGQSRWGYMNEEDVRTVVRKYRGLGLPLDMVYLDIDYMERYKDFTVDRSRFPDLTALSRELKEENVRLIPIIDAAIKEEAGYPVFEEGKARGYFCTKEDGSLFIGAVWPGRSVFTDMLNPEARAWFGNQYKALLDQGIEGFWNDMNEPAVFYTEDRLAHVLREIAKLKDTNQNLELEAFRRFMGLFGSLSHNPEDYKEFYHTVDGRRYRHDQVHNLYGYGMTRAAGEAFERLEPEKRLLLFSRASYIGMHRYGGIWQGDNKSWWSHLLLNLRMLPSLNMCGFLYTGADLGGFNCDTTEDLLLRWYALGVFTPLMRNHAAYGTREQEPYRFNDIDSFRRILGLRYRLLPYLYSEYMKAALRGDMMFRPLAFDHPDDPRCRTVEDQLYLGAELMIAPVVEQNAAGRYVYLPEDMMLIRYTANRDGNGVFVREALPAGDHYVSVPLGDVVFFLRRGRCVPLAEGGQCVADVDFEHLQMLAYDPAEPYEYYHDDGVSRDYDNPANIRWLRA